jgi:hypothetical protein
MILALFSLLVLAGAHELGDFSGATLSGAPAIQSSVPASLTRVEVRVEKLNSGRVTYRYLIINRRTTPLAEVLIGLVPSLEQPELSEQPIGWVPDKNDCPPSMQAPPGWTACVGRQEESRHVFLRFTAGSDSVYLRPNGEMAFSITVARPDSTYGTARFWALSTEFPHEEGQVQLSGRR